MHIELERTVHHGSFWRYSGRGERIRTSGLYVPNVALYQAKLHPELDHFSIFVFFKTGAMLNKSIILAAIL